MRNKIILVLIASISLFFLFLIWFKATYSMDVATQKEFYSVNSTYKVLIATQGSRYKNSVVESVVVNLKDKDVYVKVIDVSSLNGVSLKKWDALIILHNWEIWEPESNSNQFISDYYDSSEIFVISTSASGELKLKGVDGITGASSLDLIDEDVEKINDWLIKTLNLK